MKVSIMILICFFALALYVSNAEVLEPAYPTISLNLKGMDVVEVLKTLALKGNINIIVGANVRGKVTLFLKNVDITNAFEIVLAASNLASDKRGEITYIMLERDYELMYGEKYNDKKTLKIIKLKYVKAEEAEKVLSGVSSSIGKIIVDSSSNTVIIQDSPKVVEQASKILVEMDQPTETVVFELEYATVEDLKVQIEESLTPGLGVIAIDTRTNKIVVTDHPTNIAKIRNILEAFDDKTLQVLIEAKILEITLNDSFQLGVNWQAIFKDLQHRTLPGIKHEFSLENNFGLTTQGSQDPGVEFSLGTLDENDYAVMIQALHSVGDVNALSTPRITVLNNEEAKILVGSNQPYAVNTVTQGTATTTTASELKFMEIGVRLFVTPIVNREGFVTVKIRPEISSKTGLYTYGDPSTTVPIVSTTQAETCVTIKDGATIVIGGLISDERSKTVKKVPFLGDIPLIGLAFKETDDSVQKKELVIFLTPHIISGENDYMEQPSLEKEELFRNFTVQEFPSFRKRKRIDIDAEYLKEKKEEKEEPYDISY